MFALTRLRTLVAALTIVTATAIPGGSAFAREQNVERWVERDLAGYVAKELTEHPRFRDASLRFVVMHNGSPTSNVSQLALQLRDSLQHEVIDTPGVTVGWQPGSPDAQRTTVTGSTDCSADEVQYIIGLELRATADNKSEVSLRALDAIEKSWVSGFGRQWRGKLSRRQRHLAQQDTLDRAFLGQRGVPYEHTEADLVAAHLAHDLRCELMRQVSGEYVVARPVVPGDGGVNGVLDLVSNNIAGVSTLQIAVDGLQANALLEGQAHTVDGDLHQYWVTITPTDASNNLQPISTSVYVRVPRTFMSAVPAPPGKESVALESGSVLESMQLVRLNDSSSCMTRRHDYGNAGFAGRRAACLGLEIQTRDDAVVFVLNHQQNIGMVRLDDADCDYRTAARISRANEPITVALPTSLLRDAWLPENEWRLEPDADTYYAIAVSNSKAARAIGDHLTALPRRCSESVRVGFEGRELESWLTGLSSEVARWQPFVDWNAIKIKNIY
jgi:hypothetical protein